MDRWHSIPMTFAPVRLNRCRCPYFNANTKSVIELLGVKNREPPVGQFQFDKDTLEKWKAALSELWRTIHFGPSKRLFDSRD